MYFTGWIPIKNEMEVEKIIPNSNFWFDVTSFSGILLKMIERFILIYTRINDKFHHPNEFFVETVRSN
jgi:hypothetical protein